MSDAQDLPRTTPERKISADAIIEPVRKLIEGAQAAVQADCVEVGKKVDLLAEAVERDKQEVLDRVESEAREVEDRVGTVDSRVIAVRDKLLTELESGNRGQFLPLVSTILMVIVLGGLVMLVVKTWQSEAVAQGIAEDVSLVVQKGGPQPKQRDIDDIHRHVTQLVKIVPQLVNRAELKTELIAIRNDILSKIGGGSGGSGKDLTALKEKVAGLETALGKLNDGLAVKIRDQLLPIREAVEKNQPDPKVIGNQLERLTLNVTAALDAAAKKQDAKFAAMEARFNQLSSALNLPKGEDLVPVQFVLEAGGQMLNADHAKVRAALLGALDQSVRQTPGRTFGLLVARGKDVSRPLRLAKHDPAEIADLVSKPEPLIPNASNEVVWEPALDKAIGDVVLRNEPRKRLVYVTCSPATESKFDAARLARLAKGVEVWVIHLVRGISDGPSRDLAALATETGGAYLVVPSLPEDTPRQRLASRRLESVLFDALDLRAPESPSK